MLLFAILMTTLREAREFPAAYFRAAHHSKVAAYKNAFSETLIRSSLLLELYA